MIARGSLIFALLTSLILAACGPSPAEQAATATQIAADIFATLTAQAPTPTPTFTPTPTSTATPTSTPTPTPTNTPKPSPTPTPGLSSVALTWRNLPPGFYALPAAQQREMEEAYPRGSSVYVFQSPLGPQVVGVVLVPITSRAEQAAFDSTLPEFVQLIAKDFGADTDSKPLPGLDDIGDARAGITATGKVNNFSVRCDIIAFRRNEVNVIVFIAYPDGYKPAMPIGDLARLQDERIQNYLAGEIRR